MNNIRNKSTELVYTEVVYKYFYCLGKTIICIYLLILHTNNAALYASNRITINYEQIKMHNRRNKKPTIVLLLFVLQFFLHILASKMFFTPLRKNSKSLVSDPLRPVNNYR